MAFWLEKFAAHQRQLQSFYLVDLPKRGIDTDVDQLDEILEWERKELLEKIKEMRREWRTL